MKKVVSLLLASVLTVSLASTSFASGKDREVTWGVNLRKAPTTDSSIIRMLPKGEQVDVLSETSSGWLKVETAEGTVGYISGISKYTDPVDNSDSVATTFSSGSKADKIIDTAKSLIGRAEYDFGTRNPRRLIFDCSSFTEYVFEKHGIELKWGTRFQKNAGKYVSKSNLNKGDLVFFSSSSSSSSIEHVGIYIGGGDFIHILDVQGSDVHISSLNSGKWKDRYVTARRVI